MNGMYLVRTPSHHLEAKIRFDLLTIRLFCVLFGWAFPTSLASQDTDRPDRWKASAELSFTDQSGNSDLRLLTGGLNLTHLQRESYQMDAAVTSRYGRSEGDLVALNHAGALAVDLMPDGTWSPFLFTNAERDRFKRLDIRLSTGAGAKYTLYRSPTVRREASVSLALLHSFEQIAPAQPGSPPEAEGFRHSTHRARWSLRARTIHDLTPTVSLRHTTFFQPLWDEVADYLLNSDTGVKILMTERLALSVDYQLKRDARPPSGVEPDDRLLKTGLIIDF
jgi:hypothetical protein